MQVKFQNVRVGDMFEMKRKLYVKQSPTTAKSLETNKDIQVEATVVVKM